MNWSEIVKYVLMGLAFGFGFAAGSSLFYGILSLFGRSPAPAQVRR